MTDTRGGWQYETFRWHEDDGDFEAWVQAIADNGWGRSEYGPGAWSVINGRRGYGLTVRRWVERPNATPPR